MTNCNIFSAACAGFCGMTGGDPTMGGRKYSTTLSSASSALRSTHQLNLDDECRIEVYGSMRHRKMPNGSESAYLKVSVTLFHDLIDDQHDLLYLVR